MLNYPRPLQDRILIRREAAPTTTQSGLLHIPETAQDWRGCDATVLAVGPGKKLENGDRLPLTVKVGDKVRVLDLAGVEVRVDGALLALVTEDELVGIHDGRTAA